MEKVWLLAALVTGCSVPDPIGLTCGESNRGGWYDATFEPPTDGCAALEPRRVHVSDELVVTSGLERNPVWTCSMSYGLECEADCSVEMDDGCVYVAHLDE